MLRINMYICNYSSLLAVAPPTVSPGVSLSPMNKRVLLVMSVRNSPKLSVTSYFQTVV
jgi:hypothetical protein